MYLNTLFTNSNNALKILDSIDQICRESAAEAVEVYNKAYTFMEPNHPNPNHNVRVMSLAELEAYNQANVENYEEEKAAFCQGANRNRQQRRLSYPAGDGLRYRAMGN